MQVCPQCQYFTFNDKIIVTAKQILFSFQLFQQLIGICYRIIQASPYRINPYLRCRILKIILLVILIIIGNRRPLLSQYTQPSESQFFPIQRLFCHQRIDPWQRFLEAHFRCEQIFVFHLRLRFHVQPIVTWHCHQQASYQQYFCEFFHNIFLFSIKK